MKILLIGASGMIGSRILNEALGRDHSIIAGARNPEKIQTSEKVKPVKLDANDANAVAELATQADVIISAISPRSTGDSDTEARTFALALITAQRKSGKRLVMVGGAGTLNLPDGTPVAQIVPEAYAEEAKAMRKVYGLLVSEDIDFTFLSPAGLIQPGERTGKFRISGRQYLCDDEGNSKISAEDYAVALMDEVETPYHHRTVFTVAY